jgi:hypothetical protein
VPSSSSDRPQFAVYNGQNAIGYAVERQTGKWSAFTADDRRIGTYSNRRAASDAIIATAK